MVSNESIHLEVYDTTLRDGAQAEDVSFSVDDKIRIAKKLDELHQLYSLEKNLQAFGIESKDVRSRASVCRKFNWRAGGNHYHSAVKRNDPALHIFLHKCVFTNACSLDKVSYI